MTKKKTSAAVIAALIAVTAWTIIYGRNDRRPEKTLTLYGNIEIRQTDLSFMTGGQVKQLNFDEGDQVKKGDLLAVLDDRDYRAGLAKARAEEAKSMSEKENADRNYKRKIALCGDNTISSLECDQIKNLKNTAESAYLYAKSMREIAENQFEYTKLTAPEDGIISSRICEPGTTVQKGQPVCTLSKTKPVWVRVYLPEKYLGNIRYGMKTRIITDSSDLKSGKNKEYTGTVGFISPTAEFTPKTVQTTDLRTDLVYRVRIYADNDDGFLRLGMPVTVKIDLR